LTFSGTIPLLSPAFPILLSLEVAFFAMLVATPVGIALAYSQSRRRGAPRALVDGLILLPLVLPPSVTGFLLVVLLGRNGPVGRFLEWAFSLRAVFSPLGAVIASAVVALPLLVKTAQPAFESVPTELKDVARTLGLSPAAVFFRVTLPTAWRGVLAGLILAFARAIGEFGATLMLAGDIPGRTNTMPIEIFAAFQAGDDARSLMYVLVLVGISCAVVILASILSPRRVGL
jgi:molybdate transport system permease protein